MDNKYVAYFFMILTQVAPLSPSLSLSLALLFSSISSFFSRPLAADGCGDGRTGLRLQ
jgi:hypothetical protein